MQVRLFGRETSQEVLLRNFVGGGGGNEGCGRREHVFYRGEMANCSDASCRGSRGAKTESHASRPGLCEANVEAHS